MMEKIECPYGYVDCTHKSSTEEKIAMSLASVLALIAKTTELEKDLEELRKEIDNLKLKIN